MDNKSINYISRICFGGVSILNKKYLLYGYGKTVVAIKNFFDIMLVEYIIYFETNDENNVVNEIFNNKIKSIDYVIKSPGIKFDTALLKFCEAKSIEILSDLELVYRLYPYYEYILITGSNGKTTTTYLINEMLKEYPLFKHGMVGNIGIPIFKSLEESRNRRGFIVEASSFMLHNTYTLKPNVYVITNLLSHHLNYHLTDDNYFYDKTKIIFNMNDKDYLIYNLDDVNVIKYIKKYNQPIMYSVSLYNKEATCYLDDNTIFFQERSIIDIDTIIKNDYGTLYDMMIAIIVAKIYHISTRKIKRVLMNFKGLPYRLEKIFDNNSLVIYNDSKSTSPYATQMALLEVNNRYPTYDKILIMGGKCVDLNYQDMENLLKAYNLVYTYGDSREYLNEFLKNKKIIFRSFKTLDEVVNNIKFDDKMVILFSPSCVSYDQFKSFEHRGKVFNQIIYKKLC